MVVLPMPCLHYIINRAGQNGLHIGPSALAPGQTPNAIIMSWKQKSIAVTLLIFQPYLALGVAGHYTAVEDTTREVIATVQS